MIDLFYKMSSVLWDRRRSAINVQGYRENPWNHTIERVPLKGSGKFHTSAISGGNYTEAALTGGNYTDAAMLGGNYESAALEGGNYETAALDGGNYETAALDGGSAMKAKMAYLRSLRGGNKHGRRGGRGGRGGQGGQGRNDPANPAANPAALAAGPAAPAANNNGTGDLIKAMIGNMSDGLKAALLNIALDKGVEIGSLLSDPQKLLSLAAAYGPSIVEGFKKLFNLGSSEPEPAPDLSVKQRNFIMYLLLLRNKDKKKYDVFVKALRERKKARMEEDTEKNIHKMLTETDEDEDEDEDYDM